MCFVGQERAVSPAQREDGARGSRLINDVEAARESYGASCGDSKRQAVSPRRMSLLINCVKDLLEISLRRDGRCTERE